jgi:hypothetical protein
MENSNSNENENEIKEEINLEEEDEDENEENILAIEDTYESVTGTSKILEQISQMESSSISINNTLKKLDNKNKKSLNKLRLLLYQKFLNIFFSILKQHLKKILKDFKQNSIKNFANKNKYNLFNKKYKMPQFYLKSLQKQQERKEKNLLIKKKHDEYKKKKILEEKKPKKTETEIEYEKFKEKTRLEKINKIEREKYKQDLIKKEQYADRLFFYFICRRFFRILKFNNEIRNVSTIFLKNIHKKIIIINTLKKMKISIKIKKEKELKKEQIALTNAEIFYNQKIKNKIFIFLYNFKILSFNVQKLYTYKLHLKIKKNLMKNIKNFVNNEKKKNNEIYEIIKRKYLYDIKKQFFYVLIGLRKIKKDEEIKENIINKLRSKAQSLLGDFG